MHCIRVSLPPRELAVERENFMILFRTLGEFKRNTETEDKMKTWVLKKMPMEYRQWYHLSQGEWQTSWAVRIAWRTKVSENEVAVQEKDLLGRWWWVRPGELPMSSNPVATLRHKRHEARMQALADREWNDVLWITRMDENVPKPGHKVVVKFSRFDYWDRRQPYVYPACHFLRKKGVGGDDSPERGCDHEHVDPEHVDPEYSDTDVDDDSKGDEGPGRHGNPEKHVVDPEYSDTEEGDGPERDGDLEKHDYYPERYNDDDEGPKGFGILDDVLDGALDDVLGDVLEAYCDPEDHSPEGSNNPKGRNSMEGNNSLEGHSSPERRRLRETESQQRAESSFDGANMF